MDQIGKKYFYETRAGTIKHAKLVRATKAWFIFDNGDWIERYRPLFETKEELSEKLRKIAKPGDMVWLKASRGMRFEDIAEAFYEET